MADFKDFLGESPGPVALAIGAFVLAPTLLPAVGRIARPIAKGVIKTGISLYRETYASVSEATGDLVAEARAELEAESQSVPEHKSSGKSAQPRPDGQEA
jgi:Protein of unknown function (DUF5132)